MHQRVAPRITTAEAILLLTMRNQQILSRDVVTLDSDDSIDLPEPAQQQNELEGAQE